LKTAPLNPLNENLGNKSADFGFQVSG
jgi:hypothetical protein